ncbi:MAG: hypothetical protein RR304_00875 [Bacteroides sp.]
MDINSRIDWQAGMEITAQTFKELDDTIVCREQATACITHLGIPGILPATTFCCKGQFVKNKLEIERLACMALLPSGRILHIDEAVELPIPMLYGDEYYFTAGFSDTRTEFDKNGIPYSRPNYSFAIHSQVELQDSDLLPLLRLKVNEGIFSIDDKYIPVYLLFESDIRLSDYRDQFAEKLLTLAEHPNLELGEGKRSLQHYRNLLKQYDYKNSVQAFAQLTREIAQAVDYYIIRPNTEKPIELATYSVYDIQAWLTWLNEYMSAANSILNTVVLEDHSINFEALKADIKAELYAQIRPELQEALYNSIKEELKEELNESLRKNLFEYIDSQLRVELYDKLHGELSEKLYDKLYNTLYLALYNALYVPTEEEKEEFIPII